MQAIGRLHQKCRELDPDFCLASEFGHDRLIPFFDVGYRNSNGFDISTLRYVFPEWTSCQHVWAPRDFDGVNGSPIPMEYKWTFTHKKVKHATIFRPFEEVSEVGEGGSLTIKGHGLHVLVEKR